LPEQTKGVDRHVRMQWKSSWRNVMLEQAQLQFIEDKQGRTCPVCGKGVTGRPNRVCCSKKCSDTNWKRNNPDKHRAHSRKSVRKCYKANPEKFKKANKKWRKANPEKVKAINKKWVEANPEKFKKSVKKWQKANPEKVKANNKKWREANPERANELARKWQKENPEKAKESAKKWRKANHEKLKESARRWQKANPEKCKEYRHRRRARLKNNGIEDTSEFRARMTHPLVRQVCFYCGTDCTGNFHWDHRIPIAAGGPEAEWNLVIACPPCNLKKGAKVPKTLFAEEIFKEP